VWTKLVDFWAGGYLGIKGIPMHSQTFSSAVSSVRKLVFEPLLKKIVTNGHFVLEL
jgi:hypothetical protein